MAQPPFYQSSVFWAGIIISAVLSIPTAVLGNYAYYGILAYLESRKLVSQENSRKRALEFKAVVDDIRDGKRDKVLYILQLNVAALMGLMFAMTNISAVAVILALVPITEHMTYAGVRPTGICTVLLLMSAFGVIVAFRTINRIKQITRALRDYDLFLAEHTKRWEN